MEELLYLLAKSIRLGERAEAEVILNRLAEEMEVDAAICGECEREGVAGSPVHVEQAREYVERGRYDADAVMRRKAA